jgi:hypothetical protein
MFAGFDPWLQFKVRMVFLAGVGIFVWVLTRNRRRTKGRVERTGGAGAESGDIV